MSKHNVAEARNGVSSGIPRMTLVDEWTLRNSAPPSKEAAFRQHNLETLQDFEREMDADFAQLPEKTGA